MSQLFERWSQRKQRVAEDEQVSEKNKSAHSHKTAVVNQDKNTRVEPEVSSSLGLESRPQSTPQKEKKILTATDLPNPNEIEIGGSFAAFMAKNVDPIAKSAALKTLWKQPHFNEIDGLFEYGLDYSNQPKLTTEDSAALVKKVFHHLYNNTEDRSVQHDETKTNIHNDKEAVLTKQIASAESVPSIENSSKTNQTRVLETTQNSIKETKQNKLIAINSNGQT